MSSEKAAFLDQFIKKRLKIGHPGLHSEARAQTSFTDIPHPASRRMVYTTKRGDSGEVTLFITGFLDYRLTAPFERQLDERSRIEFQKQTLRISGYGSQRFEQGVQQLYEIINQFKHSYTGPVDTDQEPDGLIEASNRFFMRRNDMGSLTSLNLGPDMDPYGYLAEAAGHDYVHTEDNQVTCFRKTSTGSGKVTYEPMPLNALRKGAVVELRISLVGISTMNMKRPKIFVVLRGVNLLDEHYAKVENIRRAQIPIAFQLGKRIRFLEEGDAESDGEVDGDHMGSDNAASNDDEDEESFEKHLEKKRRNSSGF
ncbi:hypothetical protein C8J56DRAFT_1103491 [Mycena floridula]|nr:hypothetical protein C8J56DRAFT_1103491 [Mycena floridula]